MTRPLCRVLLVGLVAVGAACGSTVPSAQRAADAGGLVADEGLDLGRAEPGPAAGADGTVGDPADASATSVAADNATGSGRPGPGQAQAGRRPAEAGQDPEPVGAGAGDTAHGVTATTIEIGVPFLSRDQANLLGDVGVGSPGDTRRMAQILVDDINGRGGIAGRKLVPIFAESAGSTSTPASDQANCATWTQDQQVFAVVAYVAGGTDVIAECLAQAGTPLVSNFTASIVDREMLARYAGILYPPSLVNLDRAANLYVEGLADRGYFTRDAVVGLLRVDRPQFDRVAEKVLKPALARHGVELEEDISYSPTQTGWESNAVLRLRSSGVTHMLMLDFALPLVFLTAAESQQFRPKYGLTSYQTPQFMQTTVPAAQLRGAVGVGWWPVYDVDPAHDPGGNPATTRCLDLMRAKGQDVSQRLTQLSALITCDAFFFFEHALKSAPTISPAGLRRAVEALGRSYRSPLTFGTLYDTAHRDGAALYRDFAFVDGCSCFQYTSAERPIPG